ncbi:MFS transporter [Amycolatopsis pigmentata]|uniref:MFS transporter n=1 Tax=Amycolatopsis pigmentata TaxID=450801 RepID=A0ABW5G162_9PSEU
MTPHRQPPAETFGKSLEDMVARMRPAGREIAGIGGDVDRRGLRAVLRAENAKWYPGVALFALEISGLLHGEAFGVLQPDIGRAFGIGPRFFSVLTVFSQVIALVVPLGVARLVQNRARRAMVTLISAGVWSVLTAGTALTATVGAVGAMLLLDEATTAANGTVGDALLIDSYPPRTRVRVVSALRAGGMVAGLGAPGLVFVLTEVAHLNWRGVFLVTAALTAVFFLVALGLRDPGYGRWDTARIQQRVRTSDGRPGAPAVAATHLSILEALRRIMAIRSMRLFLWAGLISAIASPVGTYLAFYYTDRFNLDAGARSLLQLATGVVGLVSLLTLSKLGDRIFQRSPRHMFTISAGLTIVGLVLSAAQVFAPNVTVLVVLAAAGAALTGLSGPAQTVGTMSIVPAPLRPHVGAVAALFSLGGTTAGTILLGGLTETISLPTAVVIVSVPSVIAAGVTMRAGRFVAGDIDRTIDEVVEATALAELRGSGRRLPVINCRSVDFAYGPVQVLFGVDFSVDHGEMVALLGVNGAGKSTLLRAISGLGIPQSGSIRLDGQDITFLDAERRAAMGISQIPGGHAVFKELSVVDNLRCYGYSLGRDRRRLDSAIDIAFDAFPRLAERRNQHAGTLSGGEQQMLALSKALMLRPKVLLIDELSLGLAPIVVGQLLDMVRRINRAGTAVVLVEQSVNVALSLARHAYFMERGRIRFDGPSDELRRDETLLRAVFLSEVAKEGAR